MVVPRVHVEDGFRDGVEELEDARVGPLMLAEGLVVHEQVAEIAVAVDLVDPSGELLGGSRGHSAQPRLEKRKAMSSQRR